MKNAYRIVVLVLFALSITVTEASAQDQSSGWVEFEGTVASEGTTPQINVYAHGPMKGRVGWTLYMQAGEDWSEGLFGLTFAPASWLEVSTSLGLENFESPFRSGASVWAGAGRWSILSLQEDGGSGHWQKNVGKYRVTPIFYLGLLQQTFVGAGPYVEAKFGRLAFWGAYSLNGNKGLLTAQFNF